jgi:hypothetical protein
MEADMQPEQSSAASPSLRLAYADPPYPGTAHMYRDHPDYAGEVDHAELIKTLGTYDGWALSTAAKSLQYVLSLCPPDVRVLVWVKPCAPVFRGHGTYAWEPVILKGARPVEAGLRDWLSANFEMYQYRPRPEGWVNGQKPRVVCEWLFRWLGAEPGDEFTDLFPGSGAVGRAWDEWISQPCLPLPVSSRTVKREWARLMASNPTLDVT